MLEANRPGRTIRNVVPGATFLTELANSGSKVVAVMAAMSGWTVARALPKLFR